jgi:MFS family permease
LLPGVIWFFRGWVPQAYRAQYMAVFLLCIPLSSFLGSPISGAILGMDGLWGLKGWQWMFVPEGAPCSANPPNRRSLRRFSPSGRLSC